MSEDTHPGHLAINLHHQYEQYKCAAMEKRTAAADLRRRAKACTLTADAHALRQQAKPMSEEAAAAARNADQVLSAFLQKADEAQKLLTARMPPNGKPGM